MEFSGRYEVTTRRKGAGVVHQEAYDLRRRSMQLQAEMLRAKLEVETAIYSANLGVPSKPTAAKCPACGSHEFRTHNLVRVCSYCRCAA